MSNRTCCCCCPTKVRLFGGRVEKGPKETRLSKQTNKRSDQTSVLFGCVALSLSFDDFRLQVATVFVRPSVCLFVCLFVWSMRRCKKLLQICEIFILIRKWSRRVDRYSTSVLMAFSPAKNHLFFRLRSQIETIRKVFFFGHISSLMSPQSIISIEAWRKWMRESVFVAVGSCLSGRWRLHNTNIKLLANQLQ